MNGRRDVDFDARTAPPRAPWLPPAPDTPTRPYWVDPGDDPLPEPLDGGARRRDALVHLAGARYDPATKTCTSVACHLFETSVRLGRAARRLRTPARGATGSERARGAARSATPGTAPRR